MKRKLTSIILTLALCLSLLPTMTLTASAADDVIEISTAEQLKEFADRVNGGEQNLNARLTADIDLGGEEWTPIGNYSTTYARFAGSFDGGGHKITGQYIDSTEQYVGLFGYVDGKGTVKNLGVGGSVTGKGYVGGIVGENCGTIQNCYNTGTVTGNASYIGGIVGWNDHSSNGGTVTVDHCYNIGAVSGDITVYAVFQEKGTTPGSSSGGSSAPTDNDANCPALASTDLNPNAPITREQLAVMLYRYAQSKGLVSLGTGHSSWTTPTQRLSPTGPMRPWHGGV